MPLAWRFLLPIAWHFQIALTPSALTPLAWHFLLPIAFLYCLNSFNLAVSIAYCLCSSLLPFYIALTPSAWQFPNVIGALPQTLPPFLS